MCEHQVGQADPMGPPTEGHALQVLPSLGARQVLQLALEQHAACSTSKASKSGVHPPNAAARLKEIGCLQDEK